MSRGGVSEGEGKGVHGDQHSRYGYGWMDGWMVCAGAGGRAAIHDRCDYGGGEACSAQIR